MPQRWERELERLNGIEAPVGLRARVEEGPRRQGPSSPGGGRRTIAGITAIVVFLAAVWFAYGMWHERRAVPGDQAADPVLRLECLPDGSVNVLSPEVVAQADGVHVSAAFPQEGRWELAVTHGGPSATGQPASVFDQGAGMTTADTVLAEVAPGMQQVASFRSDVGTITWATDVVPNMRPFEVVDPEHFYTSADLSCPADGQVKKDPRDFWPDVWPDVPTPRTLSGVLPTDVVERAGYPAAHETWTWFRIVRDEQVIAAVLTRNEKDAMDVVACADSGILGA